MSVDGSPANAHEMEPDLSRLLVQLLQVLLAFFLGQALIQNRILLIDLTSASSVVGLLALLAVAAYAIDGWVDWHVDVARHPYQVGPSNPHRRWGLTRFWLDVTHVLVIGYLGQTIVHVHGGDGSLVRHLSGYVAAHLLLVATTACRDVTYGHHHGHEGVARTQLMTAAVLFVVIVGYWRLRPDEGSEAVNVVVLVIVVAVNAVHHAVMRRRRMLA